VGRERGGTMATWPDDLSILAYTEKTQYRKFETNIPREGIARPQSQFPLSCVYERLIYSHNRSVYSIAEKMWTDLMYCISLC
jgi:hypothetical protein